MKKQVYNPFLPSWEYVPDAEPRVFDGRVYIYGSHDAFGAPIFCVNDYVCWSAPVTDLADWRFEGTIFRKKQDPHNKLGIHCLYAPDVAKGTDGRYYLYYAFDFMGEMGVAVCDEPAGKYEFYGHVHFKDGHVWGKRSGEPFPFDPGVLVDDDGKVYLYSGFATKVPPIATHFHDLTNEGGVVLELEPDMVTVKAGPELLFPTKGKKGAFPNHAFFEASSIRKIDGKYYFVYSSQHNHELCYAMSDSPKGPFTFGGTLVDIGDLYLDGNEDECKAKNYLGNTHGGMVEIGGQWYIFYHRQTNRSSYARQACAEKLVRTEEGRFLQAEVTSCGLNHGPLRGLGKYPARIACSLWSKDGSGRYDCRMPKKVFQNHPYFTQSGKDREGNGSQYIANMRDGSVAGFKYFAIDKASCMRVCLRGRFSGKVQVSTKEDFSEICAEIAAVSVDRKKELYESKFEAKKGMHALFFRFIGTGSADFLYFELK